MTILNRTPLIVNNLRFIDTIFVFHYSCVIETITDRSLVLDWHLYFADIGGLSMKNITITLPEDVARWLRVKAAENERSVSKWLAELLESMQRQEDEYEVAMERFLTRARKPRKIEWIDGRKPTREELYDRPGLR